MAGKDPDYLLLSYKSDSGIDMSLDKVNNTSFKLLIIDLTLEEMLERELKLKLEQVGEWKGVFAKGDVTRQFYIFKNKELSRPALPVKMNASVKKTETSIKMIAADVKPTNPKQPTPKRTATPKRTTTPKLSALKQKADENAALALTIA